MYVMNGNEIDFEFTGINNLVYMQTNQQGYGIYYIVIVIQK